MVGLEGFEPPTHGLGNRCSILLSYRPVQTTCWNSLAQTDWIRAPRLAWIQCLASKPPYQNEPINPEISFTGNCHYTVAGRPGLPPRSCSVRRFAPLTAREDFSTGRDPKAESSFTKLGQTKWLFLTNSNWTGKRRWLPGAGEALAKASLSDLLKPELTLSA